MCQLVCGNREKEMQERARRKPPFRAEHIGSLRRPASLIKARERLLGMHDHEYKLVPHDNAELREIENAYIKDWVRRQESIGLRAITDGELRRRTYWGEFIAALDGIDAGYRGEMPNARGAEGNILPRQFVDVIGKIRWTRSVNLKPFQFLKSVTGQTAKITIPSPPTIFQYGGRDAISRTAYPDLDEFWDDVAEAYRAEIKALAAAGCTYIQFDDITICFLCDEKQRDALRQHGAAPDLFMRDFTRCINRITADRPSGMTIAIHTCRGNYQGNWLAEGGYDRVAEYIFNNVDVDAFFLEYDSPRAGGFEPLRFFPANKIAILGLVSTKTPILESTELLKSRIDEATKFIPVERIGLSPQCGFSSSYHGNPVTIDDQWRKLELVVSVAREVWGSA
jgi:5-methyltetrahydropteroyltriglutamate--homocysteine methyltransferase